MATETSVKQEALRLMGEVRLASLSEETERNVVIDAVYDDGAIDYVQSQGWWNFCMESASVTATVLSGRSVGYSYGFPTPASWLRTHSVGLRRHGGLYYQIDHRIEADGIISVDFETVVHRYLERKGNLANWPEPFAKAFSGYLAFEASRRLTGDANLTAAMWQIYQQRLSEGLAQCSEPDPIPLGDRGWYRAVVMHLEMGAWKFATKTVALVESTTVDPIPGYSYCFDKPDDWLRTIRVYTLDNGTNDDRHPDVVLTDQGPVLHTNEPAPIIRYISTAGIDPNGFAASGSAGYRGGWTERFTEAVYSYLKFKASQDEKLYVVWQRALQEALLKDAMNDGPRINRNGNFVAGRLGMVNREQSKYYG